jgi:hypothetical protein
MLMMMMMIVIVEHSVELTIGKETDVFGGNVTQVFFLHHKSH